MVMRIDRPGRSVQHLVRVVDDLKERGIQFRSLHEGIDTTTGGVEMFFVIFAAIGLFSGRLISERTHEGLVATRAGGRRGGRLRTMTEERITTDIELRAKGRTLDQIGKILGVSASTVSRSIENHHHAL